MSEFWKIVLTWFIQIFTGYLPQGFLFMLFVYIGCKKKVDKMYIYTGILLSIGIAISRNLPVVNGVITLLNIFLLICIGIFVCKFPADKTIIYALLITIILTVIELLVFAVSVGYYLWNAGVHNTDVILREFYTITPDAKKILGIPLYLLTAGLNHGDVILDKYYNARDPLNWAIFSIPSTVILCPIVLLSYRKMIRKGKEVKKIGSAD